MKITGKGLLLLLTLAGVAGVCWWRSSIPHGNQIEQPGQAAVAGAHRYAPMRLDVPAVIDPQLEYADEVALDDEAIVIGIVVNGEPRAYLRDAFEMDPRLHVVSDSIDSTPVAITHCDRVRCTRVLTGPQLEDLDSIRVGGWRADQTLALIVGEEEYSQKSPEIPLADVPYLEIPWSQWRELFPESLVYVGVENKSSG